MASGPRVPSPSRVKGGVRCRWSGFIALRAALRPPHRPLRRGFLHCMFSAPPSNTSCVYAHGFVRVLSKWARHRLRDRTWTAGATRARRRGQRLGRAARRGAREDEPNREPRRRGPLHLTPALRSVPHGLRFSGGSVGSRAPRACSGGGDAPSPSSGEAHGPQGPQRPGRPVPGSRQLITVMPRSCGPLPMGPHAALAPLPARSASGSPKD